MAVRKLALYPEIINLWMNGFVFITSSMKLPREASCLRRAISGLIALFIFPYLEPIAQAVEHFSWFLRVECPRCAY